MNYELRIKNSQRGYTLVELLAVMIILVSVGTVIAAILFTSLRGGNKSNTTNDVRQNGNYITSQISKMIAYARSFDGVSVDGSAGSYITDCTTIQSPPVAFNYIKITSFDGGQTVFSCSNGTIASNAASLVNTSNFTVSSCNFYCSQSNSSAPSININFTLSKANSGFFVENQTTIPFDTTITPRNN